MHVPLGIWSNRNRIPYRTALMMVLGGAIPGAERRNGRWHVDEDAQAIAGAVPPEVRALHQVTTGLSAHPLQLVATRGL